MELESAGSCYNTGTVFLLRQRDGTSARRRTNHCCRMLRFSCFHRPRLLICIYKNFGYFFSFIHLFICKPAALINVRQIIILENKISARIRTRVGKESSFTALLKNPCCHDIQFQQWEEEESQWRIKEEKKNKWKKREKESETLITVADTRHAVCKMIIWNSKQEGHKRFITHKRLPPS